MMLVGKRGERIRCACLLVFFFVCVGTTSAARGKAPASESKNWEFSVAPYLFVPWMKGNVTVKGIEQSIDTNFFEIVDSSDFTFGLMAHFEAWRKKNWGLLFDGSWLIVKQNDNRSETRFENDLTMNMGWVEFAGLYSFSEGPRSFAAETSSATWDLQGLVGARVTIVGAELDFDKGGSRDQTKALADPIIGLRAMFRFGNEGRWSASLRGDVGGFGAGSEFTWNAIGLFGYDFHICDVPATFLLGAKGFFQKFDFGSGEDKFRYDVTQFGPLLALNFRF